MSSWPISTPNAQPEAVGFAPDGSFWLSLPNASRIARVAPDGTIREFAVPNAPLGLAVAKDGGVWFGSPSTKKLGRLDAATGKISWTDLPEVPVALATGLDGSVWVALGVGDRLAKVPPKG